MTFIVIIAASILLIWVFIKKFRKPAAVAFVVLIVFFVFRIAWSFLHTRDSVKTEEVDTPFTLSAKAPWPTILGTGSMFLMYEGVLDGTATLDVTSNMGRDSQQINLGTGAIKGIYGGAEEWVSNIQVRYRPESVKSGKIYAVVICGNGMNNEESKLYQRILRK